MTPGQRSESLSGYLVLSVALHGAVLVLTAAATVMAGWWAPRYEPPESIEVAMVALPKSRSNVPDRASRVKRASGDQRTAEPPAVRESDLSIHRDRPDPKPGNTKDAAQQELLDQQKREDLLKDLLSDAPEGDRDQMATDPDGVEDLDLAVLGAGARGDPEVMRWQAEVQKLLMSRFKPIDAITQGRTDLVCIVNIFFDPVTGEITDHEITKSSGLGLYDNAAERVVIELSKLPLPPEKYRKLFARDGVGIRFTPPAP